MDKKVYKALCQEVDSRTLSVLNAFNIVAEEYELHAKSKKWELLRKQSRNLLIKHYYSNGKMMDALDTAIKNIQDGTVKLWFIKRFQAAYYLSKAYNYYLYTNQTLIECAKVTGIIDEDENYITYEGDTDESK